VRAITISILDGIEVIILVKYSVPILVRHELWLDWATIQFRFFGPNSCYTGSFCVFGPVLSSPAHALMSLDMR
jgi:hypothetical protein